MKIYFWRWGTSRKGAGGVVICGRTGCSRRMPFCSGPIVRIAQSRSLVSLENGEVDQKYQSKHPRIKPIGTDWIKNEVSGVSRAAETTSFESGDLLSSISEKTGEEPGRAVSNFPSVCHVSTGVSFRFEKLLLPPPQLVLQRTHF